MSQDVIERIRDRWQKLRLCRHRGTVMTDYRILRISFASIRPWRDSMNLESIAKYFAPKSPMLSDSHSYSI
jgi:hypothetical protein